ncbi:MULTISPECIES: TetR/AcrR family transcriptional regulator [Acinetobacter]|uniref:TetR/AcrR family transcriptional regulator n=1 Tax=Acinetobacter piscicola TaxID=2006115 RepID=A0A4Q4GZB7_9GAMM|nr:MULTISPECIES: TetR/AcrR family transcriptional regulator [Acinetobacter]MDM1759236.1 TetR/AcrR family transcriptional regulator [Acinetobacter sp. 256-1]QOW46340.1 TetR/AcrR family transcriptional regulator [Acinetobacter piscicola]RYL27834.1 TetR/AcrR family transcriptional regulator [Acinetobacter piscicola]
MQKHFAEINAISCGEQPQTRRGQQRRLALLLSANELFLEHGYEAVSLDDIVNHAGGSKTSIYKYFGNKEGLFTAICDYRRDLFFKDICACYNSEEDHLRHYLVQTLINFYLHLKKPENIAFIRLIIEQAQKNPNLALYIHEKGAHYIQLTIAKALEHSHAQGILNCTNPYSSAMMYFGILRDFEWRVLMGLEVDKPEQEVIKHIEYCVDHFLKGHQKV